MISNTYVDGWLVVILCLELAIVVFGLHAYLWHWVIVDAAGENLLGGVFL